MSRNILLVSYDDRLLVARRRLLEQEGYQVSSVLRLKEALSSCGDGSFDLFILGSSVPRGDKEKLIRAFRVTCAAPILSIWTHHEGLAEGVSYLAFSDAPDKLLANVAAIFAKGHSARAAG
jgi:DNA-binding response OmpR family regulator